MNAFDLASKLMMGAVNPLISPTSNIRRETTFMANGDKKTIIERLVKELNALHAHPEAKGRDVRCCTIHLTRE
jgi:hypothetical protein